MCLLKGYHTSDSFSTFFSWSVESTQFVIISIICEAQF